MELDDVYIVDVDNKPKYYSYYLPACRCLARQLASDGQRVTIKCKRGSSAKLWERTHARRVEKVPNKFYQ